MRRGEQPQGRPQQRQPTPPPCDHLPQSVRQVWQQVWNDERCKNLSLLLDRYAPWRKSREGIWDMRMRYRRGARIEEATGQGAKGLWLRDDEGDLVDAPIKPNSRIDELLLEAFKERWHCLLDWYRQRGYEIREFKAEPTWRFVVGLGAAHVLETGITLHRIFGLPIIPASGLKGAARAYALYELANKLGIPVLSPAEAIGVEKTPLQKFGELIEFFAAEVDNQKRQAELDEFLRDKFLPPDAPLRKLDLDALVQKTKPFVDVFGTTKRAGKIVFLDAVPISTPKLELDIMNPHYPKYYDSRGESPPADWESPRPVFFLTVSETLYSFALAARTEDANVLDKAERWLKGALTELGIGAKTSSGYGYWEL